MVWAMGGIVVLVVLVLAGGAWMFAPTLRTFFGPDFEAAPKDDASVEAVQQMGIPDAGGGM
jgi:hypothetical protein